MHERKLVSKMLKKNTNNAVVLSGDSHDAWAFTLTENGDGVTGDEVGVNLCTASVASPGWAAYLPKLHEMGLGSSGWQVTNRLWESATTGLKYADVKDKGFMAITVTRNEHIAEFIAITDSLDSIKTSMENIQTKPYSAFSLHAPFKCAKALKTHSGQPGSLDSVECGAATFATKRRRELSAKVPKVFLLLLGYIFCLFQKNWTFAPRIFFSLFVSLSLKTLRAKKQCVVLVCVTLCSFSQHTVMATHSAKLGPRVRYLVEDMEASDLKTSLQTCLNDNTMNYVAHDFSIGHRGAAMMFPEHTEESYIAAMEMGAGIVECDVAVTKDGELVCRHDQCDLHTSTNILVTDLASKCSIPFVAASTPTIWTEIAYPQGGAKHLVMTSPKVTSSAFPHGEVTLEYHTMYRTGDVFGSPAPPLLWTRSAQAVCDCCVS